MEHDLECVDKTRMGNELTHEYKLFSLFKCKKCNRYFYVYEIEKNGQIQEVINDTKKESCT